MTAFWGVAWLVPMLLQATPPNLSGPMTDQQFRQQIALEAIRNRGHAPGGPLALLVPLGLFAMVLGIVWLRVRQRQAQMRAQAELQKQLLDKFSTGRDFAEFLESKASQRFLAEMWAQGPQRHDRILSAMRNGIILAVVGLALLGLALARRQLVFPGVLLLAIGAGYLISTAAMSRMSEKLVRKHEFGGPGEASPEG